jgi:glycosyltransferase involved in cell wall biosynthesis
MEKGVTILICTYNGSLRIPETIAHIAAQRFSKAIAWEVLFVDNASTDGSSTVAIGEWNKYTTAASAFRVIHESTPGKLYALQKAISEARYEYFIICDDDNWLDPLYVERVYDILESDPRIGAVGGQGIAATGGVPLPDWFEQASSDYAVGKQGAASGDITKREYLWGAGMGSRTALYKKMYHNFPSLLIGQKGVALSVEDAEYSMRMILAGYKLYYHSDLIFSHFITPNRLVPGYREGLANSFTASDIVLEKYRLAVRLQRKYDRRPLRKFISLIGAFFKSRWSTSNDKRVFYQSRLQYLLPSDNGHDQMISAIRKFKEENPVK